ncbi:response regulator transcription factor [Larkinella soli]|uniref:response regulator transcription factor n=1 Tax=Larkinella soli TaxID=1770527 RepID=UPI000FFBA4F5|nr:LytTR family transcriptional regulator DNA-binding domain-containing protein [Larkinella soli]
MIQEAIQHPALIKYLKGFSNYTWLYYCDGNKLLIAKPLSYFEKRLNGFLRVHKTAMVNPYYIRDFTPPARCKMAGAVHLMDGLTLPVSRRRWMDLYDSITEALLRSSSSFQAEADPLTGPAQPGRTEAAVPGMPQPKLYVAMADEIKAGLLRQLVEDRWPQWNLRFFNTGDALQKALSTAPDTELPGMIMLDGGQDSIRSLSVLRSIKNSQRLRMIPTLVLAPSGTHEMARQGYALGANSVILHPSDFTLFIQAIEKVFRYWLWMAASPQASARVPVSGR